VKVSVGELLRRINGVSTPFGGVQWSNGGSPDKEVVRRLLTFLEDRRALYGPRHSEEAPHVSRSILEIRSALTAALQDLPDDAAAVQPLRTMRAACRRFLDATEPWGARGFPNGYREEAEFWIALGELRSTVGYQLAVVCSLYGLEAEDELKTILPDEDTDTHKPRRAPARPHIGPR
jgi:hypothetical protein